MPLAIPQVESFFDIMLEMQGSTLKSATCVPPLYPQVRVICDATLEMEDSTLPLVPQVKVEAFCDVTLAMEGSSATSFVCAPPPLYL